MLRTFISCLIICLHCTFSLAVDYDAIVVGTSPISLLEALHRHYSGQRVLIIEKGSTYGGVWKSIHMCGVPNAELGCHLIGANSEISDFFEKYVGCQTVSMDNPHLSYNEYQGANGFYFAGGCQEMMQNLIQLIEATDIVVLLNHHLDSITLDRSQHLVIAHTQDKHFSTTKIIVTPYSQIKIDNHPTIPLEAQESTKTRHYHLYVLIEDATAPKFSYRGGIGNGSLRIMNLTSFVGLEGTGLQLIVFQVQNANAFQLADTYLTSLKKQGLVDGSAYIQTTETFTYEQSQINHAAIKQFPNGPSFFEILHTHKMTEMTRYIPKWKTTLPLFKEVIP